MRDSAIDPLPPAAYSPTGGLSMCVLDPLRCGSGAAALSYETDKRTSRHPEAFGKGVPEGCMAAEAGNNAVPAGVMIVRVPTALLSVSIMVISLSGTYAVNTRKKRLVCNL